MISYIDGEYRGLAADKAAMDTSSVPNMAKFVEADTGKVYYYDLENTQWVTTPDPAPESSDAQAETPAEGTSDAPAEGTGETEGSNTSSEGGE